MKRIVRKMQTSRPAISQAWEHWALESCGLVALAAGGLQIGGLGLQLGDPETSERCLDWSMCHTLHFGELGGIGE